ncbi:MAG: aldo/keto reductase [Blautia sp.]|nr:aldo/keto reductase [Blautia sp.]
MPLLGLGVYKIENHQAQHAVSAAVKAGYRLFDTASVYKNEEIIGRALSRCGIPRDRLFITSKIWNTAQRLADVEGALDRSLERLKLDYIDMYMIHWPVPGCYLNTWTAMADLLESHKVLSLGVCNFSMQNLEELSSISGIVPVVNQIEVHPLCYPQKLIEYCQSRGIVVQAYAPLARGAYLDHDVLCVLATKYAKTPAQIGLRWAVQKGISVIPKSANPARIVQNADLWNFSIEPEDMQILDSLNADLHTSGIPEDLIDILHY